MSEKFSIGGHVLAKVHRKSNNIKLHCYLTGFLEGILASGAIEDGEVGALETQCADFVANLNDPDAAEILEDLSADLLEYAGLLDIVKYRSESIDLTCTKSELNRFFGYCAGVACDNIITEKEAMGLIEIISSSEVLSKNELACAVKFSCEDALLDGIVSGDQSDDICKCITMLVGDSYSDTGLSSLGGIPVFEETTNYLLPIDVNEKLFVLTGSFAIKPRKKMEVAIKNMGGKIAKNVTMKTDYLVIAMEASRDWKYTHKGLKISRALEIREENNHPSLVSESTVMKVLKL